MTITIVRILFWLIILVVAIISLFWLISILSTTEAILLPTATPTQPSLITPYQSSTTPKLIEKITVPSNLASGINYIASNTGTYTFKYADSAFTAYGGCWSTRINVYLGPVPLPNENDASFSLGSASCATSKDKAIERTKGEIANIKLNAGDTITLVVGDSSYSDNIGSIILEIYFMPKQ